VSFKFASAFAAIAIAAVAIAPAHAKKPMGGYGVTYTVAVSYADLDLTQAKDIKKLNRRLNRALDRVCGDPRDKALSSQRRAIRDCRMTAKSAAIASVQAPLVLAALQGPVRG